MASAASLLVLGVLLLALVEAESLAILHSYPEPGNFSYVELACVANDSDGAVVAGARFQLNGTDIEDEELVVETQDSGAVRIVLTQEKEGFFTCSENESVSNNSIGLAAEPRINTSTDPLVYLVKLPDSVIIILQCDITQGRLLQRYSVQWIQVSSNIIPLNISSTSNLSLNVTRSTNGLQYQCQVTVDHDGNSSVTYYGNITITVQVAAPNSSASKPTPPTPPNQIIIIVGVVVGLTVLKFAVILILLLQYRLIARHRQPQSPQLPRINLSSSYHLTSILPTIDCDDDTLTLPERSQNMFIDEDNDFKLEIPEGAVPDGEATPTISLGVTLFGPFQFAEGLRPVSPVFRVCISDKPDFRFSKPVTITIPHFLDLETNEDIQNLGLTFLKAGHNKNSEGLYEFHQTDGDMTFNTHQGHGILSTSHFCSLCIAARDTPLCLQKTRFCITAALPTYAVQVGKKVEAYFYITFLNLNTCLKKVDDLIAKRKLRDYKVKRESFKFKTGTRHPALEMVCENPKYGMIGMVGKKKIFRSEVDFFVRRRPSEAELESLGSDEFYPPRFEVFLVSHRENATLSDGKISFKGATTDIEFNTHLDIPDQTTLPARDDVRVQIESQPLGRDDLQEVRSKLMDLQVKWRDIGLELGLTDSQLEPIEADNGDITSRLTAMLRRWLNRAYDTTRYGEPSWQRLSQAVRCRAGGNNPFMADQILEKAMNTSVL